MGVERTGIGSEEERKEGMSYPFWLKEEKNRGVEGEWQARRDEIGIRSESRE